MNKIVFLPYLGDDQESLMVANAGIKGVHGLPLDGNSPLYQLQRVIKSIKCWCCDNEIPKNVTTQVFPPSRQACQ